MDITASLRDTMTTETMTDNRTPVISSTTDGKSSTAQAIVQDRQRNGSMGDQLREATKLSAFGAGKKFIPRVKIDEIVTPETVQSELDASGCGREVDSPNIVQYIFASTGYRKIFAILSLINHVDDIKSFIHDSVSDDCLPLQRRCRIEGRAVLFPNSLLQKWPKYVLQAFEEHQWMFLAPVFDLSSKRIRHHIIDNEACLPFLLDIYADTNPIEERAFKVWKVTIDPSHTCIDPDDRRKLVVNKIYRDTYAIKQLHDGKDSAHAFTAEVTASKRLSRSPNEGVVLPLATYVYKGRYHIISPWADGDLVDLWQTTSPPHIIGPSFGLWFADELLGLVEGLKRIQAKSEIYGIRGTSEELPIFRHDDITPRNILWFKDWSERTSVQQYGRLVHTALGTSCTAKFTRPRDFFRRTETYIAPEFKIENCPITERSVTWSLGCVLLEFITWAVGGWKLVDEFANWRLQHELWREDFRTDHFFVIFPVGGILTAVVKQRVTEWCHRLRKHARCTAYMNDLISMIMSGLLQVQPRKRMTTEHVLRSLQEMRKRGAEDESYISQLAVGRDGSSFTAPHEASTYSCPFRKRNPRKFNVRDYQTCALSSFPDISQLKKHVLGVHKRPRDANALVADDPEYGISDEADLKLRDRKAGRQVLEWDGLWAVLFPNDKIIPIAEYEPVVEDHEIHRQLLDITMLCGDPLQSVKYPARNVTMDDIWHLAQAVISERLGLKTVTGNAPESTMSLRRTTVPTLETNRRRHTTKTGIKREKASNSSDLNGETRTQDLERPSKILRQLAPASSLFATAVGRVLLSNVHAAGELAQNRGHQRLLHASEDGSIMELDVSSSPSHNANAQAQIPDLMIGTENGPFQLQETFDTVTEIPGISDALSATKQHEEYTYLDFGLNQETLDPMQQMEFSNLEAQDIDAFDVNQFLNDSLMDDVIDFEELGNYPEGFQGS